MELIKHTIVAGLLLQVLYSKTVNQTESCPKKIQWCAGDRDTLRKRINCTVSHWEFSAQLNPFGRLWDTGSTPRNNSGTTACQAWRTSKYCLVKTCSHWFLAMKIISFHVLMIIMLPCACCMSRAHDIVDLCECINNKPDRFLATIPKFYIAIS